MIKNKTQLARLLGKDARLLLDIAEFTIQNLLPEKILQKEIKKISINKYKKIVIFGIGKAAKTMAKATLTVLKGKNRSNKQSNLESEANNLDKAKTNPSDVGQSSTENHTKIQTLLADSGHPFPTQKGLQKTKKIINTAKSLTQNDLAIVLLSGGGSAMFVQPADKITLEEKITLTKQLLKSGANIQEVNTIRKHLSQVKGGNFAKLLYPANVKCFVISDVIGNDLSIIASGPLSPDPSTFKDAIKILEKYKITPPENIQKHLESGSQRPELETPKSKLDNSDRQASLSNDYKFFKNIKIKILSDHNSSANLAAKRAKQLKLNPHILSTNFEGESREMAKKLCKMSQNAIHDLIKRGRSNEVQEVERGSPNLLIATGETTVTCKGSGHGGRNQEFVLAALPYLKNQTILSIGTDGIDGICPEKIAGAIANNKSQEIAQEKNLKISAFLDNNDSYTFFKNIGGLIKTGATGSNVGDLILIYTSGNRTAGRGRKLL